MKKDVQQEILEELRALRQLHTQSHRDFITSGAADDKEIVDPTPMEIPIQFQGPPTQNEIIQQMVRQEVSHWATEQNLGTFEEEDDFEDSDPETLDMTQYELTEYQMEEDVTTEDASPPGATDRALSSPVAAEPSPTTGDPAPAEGAPAAPPWEPSENEGKQPPK